MSDNGSPTELLVIEMFAGGSHSQLVSFLISLTPSHILLTLPGTKWHWRARCGALQLLPQLREHITRPPCTLFMTSVGSLSELVSLSPALSHSNKVVYFHENQLVYPRQQEQYRDYQYGYNQIMSALMADSVLFNSQYNMSSFLDNVDIFLNKMPDFKPKGIAEVIRVKSRVLYFPLEFPTNKRTVWNCDILHIVWPHRWEHDKNPKDFFKCLEELIDSGYKFMVSVLGNSYEETPHQFDDFKSSHPDVIAQWGPLPSRDDYLEHLKGADVVVSTATHEFFGVAMLEGVWAGCYPICPNRLSYPEIYPRECLYNTTSQLNKQLRQLCKHPGLAKQKWDTIIGRIDLEKFSSERLKAHYCDALGLKLR